MYESTYIPAEITKDVFDAQLEDYGVDWDSITTRYLLHHLKCHQIHNGHHGSGYWRFSC